MIVHNYYIGKALTEALSEAQKIGIAFGVIIFILLLLLCIVIILVLLCFTIKQRNEKKRHVILEEVKESKNLPEVEISINSTEL